MTNSSDWIAQASRAVHTAPSWIAALDARDGFASGAPFGSPGDAGNGPAQEPTRQSEAPADLEADAFAKGVAEGRASALAEFEAANARHRALRLAFRTLDQAALDSLAKELADTVAHLCGQVLNDLCVDSDALLKRCEDAAKRMGGAAEQCTLRLHPEDIAMIGEAALNSWSVQADPALEPGSLRLEGPDGAVHDGPAEWRRAIEAALKT